MLIQIFKGRITSNFGVGEVRLNDTVNSVIERADKALYKAKI